MRHHEAPERTTRTTKHEEVKRIMSEKIKLEVFTDYV